MRFITPKTFTGAEGSVTRASTATYVDSDGVLKTAAANVLRVDYQLGTKLCLGALIEPAATNLLTRSATLSDAIWSKSSSTVTPDFVVAPDGTLAADKCLTPPTTSGGVFQAVNVTPGQTYTFSFFARRATETAAGYRVFNQTGSSNIVAPTSYYSEINAASWSRISVTFTAPAGCLIARVYVMADMGAASGAYIWGAQCEVGSTATSYIPTAASTASRAADVISGTGPCLVHCNASETYGSWDGGISYALGARAIAGIPGSVYESLIAGNAGQDPLLNPLAWQRIGPSNRYAALDQSSGTATTRSGPVTIGIRPGLVDSLAVLDVIGNSVAVRMYDASGASVYASTTSMQTRTAAAWWDYFFGPIVRQTSLVLDSIPPISAATIFVTIDDPASAAIGTLAVGRMTEMGGTFYGAEVGITDYSRKETDEFGATTVVERGFARRLNAKVQVESTDVDFVTSQLARIRAKPVVWDGLVGYDAGAILGWAREWSVDVAYPTVSYCSLTIEGLA